MQPNELQSLSRTILDPNAPIVFPYGFNFNEVPLQIPPVAINERQGCLVICDKNRIYHCNPYFNRHVNKIHEYFKGTKILSIEEFYDQTTFYLLGKENDTFFVDEFKNAEFVRRITTFDTLPEGTRSLTLVADREKDFTMTSKFLWLLKEKTHEFVIEVLISGESRSMSVPKERTISITHPPKLILSHGSRNSIFLIPATGEIEFFPLIEKSNIHSYKYGIQDQCPIKEVIEVSQSDPTGTLGNTVTLLQSNGKIAIAEIMNSRHYEDSLTMDEIFQDRELIQTHNTPLSSLDSNHPFCSIDHVPILYQGPQHTYYGPGSQYMPEGVRQDTPDLHICFAASKEAVHAYSTPCNPDPYKKLGYSYEIKNSNIISKNEEIQRIQFWTVLSDYSISLVLTCKEKNTDKHTLYTLYFHTRKSDQGMWEQEVEKYFR